MKSTIKKFKEFLNKHNIVYEEKNGKIIIGGDLYLSSLTSVPENFNPSVGGNLYLSSLTSVPENFNPSVGGNLDLSSLTSVPENFNPSVGGDLDLSSPTSVPENFNPSVGGNLYLSSPTSVPENFNPSVGGNLDLRSLTSVPENFNPSVGGDLDLSSLTSVPENFNPSVGGNLYLRSKTISIKISYLKRFNIKIKRGNIILYKKVSNDFKTQENTENETLWKIGIKVIHPNWYPSKEECGVGKFHGCAKPFWCDIFRNKKGDRYIAIKVKISNLYEWTNNPSYPQKIGFRKGIVMAEVKRTEEYNL